MKTAAVAAAAALLAWAGGAGAHNRGMSYSDWALTADGATVTARISQLELTRLALQPQQPDYAAQVAALAAGRLQLWAGAARCAADAPAVRAGADGWVLAHWRVRCAGAGIRTVRTSLLHDVAPSHLHFARVQPPAGAASERVLTFAEPAFVVAAPAAPAATLPRYVQLGVEHILSGWDHLAFVVALLLLATGWRELALVVTGFTVAHSLTLAAAVLGLAAVRDHVVEALIGFSIALVAVENLWLRGGRRWWPPVLLLALLAVLAATAGARVPLVVPAGLALFTACYFALAREAAQPLRLRVAVAFVFGLVHGFGFAGALAPLQLPPDRLAAGLLGFNIGVELGQLLVIALVWPVLQLLARRPPLRLAAGDTVSAAVCALGTFWFVTRILA